MGGPTWYVLAVHGILVDRSVRPFGLLSQGRLLVAQCDLRFNRLAQGAVDLADSLGICRCILGPSARGGVGSDVVLRCVARSFSTGVEVGCGG